MSLCGKPGCRRTGSPPHHRRSKLESSPVLSFAIQQVTGHYERLLGSLTDTVANRRQGRQGRSSRARTPWPISQENVTVQGGIAVGPPWSVATGQYQPTDVFQPPRELVSRTHSAPVSAGADVRPRRQRAELTDRRERLKRWQYNCVDNPLPYRRVRGRSRMGVRRSSRPWRVPRDGRLARSPVVEGPAAHVGSFPHRRVSLRLESGTRTSRIEPDRRVVFWGTCQP